MTRFLAGVLLLLTALSFRFLLALALGGFAASGAVVIWSLLAPIGAFLIGGRRGHLHRYGTTELPLALYVAVEERVGTRLRVAIDPGLH